MMFDTDILKFSREN